MADWATISALATAGGTLVLAVATFASVRSANAAARTAERAYLAALRPVLLPTRVEDPAANAHWGDGHGARLSGGTGYLRSLDGVVYYAAAFRNAGTGLAVIHGWAPATTRLEATAPAPAVDDFRPMTLDIYVPAGESAAWMAAVREADSGLSRTLRSAVEADEPLTVDLLYGDAEGGQRTITRFGFLPDPDEPGERPERLPGG